MRRADKEVVDLDEVRSILNAASVCNLAMCDEGQPYIVPLCFGYEGSTLYFHSALEGRKLEVLRKNPHVCFEADVGSEVVESKEPCSWSMKYKSVIGFGKASFVEDLDGKREALDAIMRHYLGARSSGGSFCYSREALGSTVVIKVEIVSISGKKSQY